MGPGIPGAHPVFANPGCPGDGIPGASSVDAAHGVRFVSKSTQSAAPVCRLGQWRDKNYESDRSSAARAFAQVSAAFGMLAVRCAAVCIQSLGSRPARDRRTEALSVRAQSGKRLNPAHLSAGGSLTGRLAYRASS